MADGSDRDDQDHAPDDRDHAREEIKAIVAEAIVVGIFLLAIVGVEGASHCLVPPTGPVFYQGTNF
jgi:hypothetical protein